MDIDRREAVRRVAALLGGAALVGGSGLLTACADERARAGAAVDGAGSFTPDDIALLDDIADTILPETGTPGARAARVGAFIALMVTDTYEPRDQEVLREGLRTLDRASIDQAGAPFRSAAPEARLALLEALDREQHELMTRKADGEPAHYFRMLKELTLLGYFTSEIGYTRAMRYVETPGRFDPCEPYTPGAPASAPHDEVIRVASARSARSERKRQ